MGEVTFAALVAEMRKYQRRRWEAKINKRAMKANDLRRMIQLEGLVDAALKKGVEDGVRRSI